MAYTLSLHRSPDGTNWTQLAVWESNGGPFADWIPDTPGAGTFTYELRIDSDDSADLVATRRIAVIAGNR